jgi:hypothetical protein
MLMYLQVLVLDNGDVVALGQTLGNVANFTDFLYSSEAVSNIFNND